MARFSLFRTVWGLVEHAPASILSTQTQSPYTSAVLQHLKGLGYRGLEASLADLGANTAERRESVVSIANHNMKLIIGAYTSWNDYEGSWGSLSDSPSVQLERLRAQVGEIETVAAGAPSGTLVHINAHCGGDGWADHQAEEFFRVAVHMRPRVHNHEISLSHETHRGRPLGCAFRTARLCEQLPELRLTLDMSHWVISAERLIGAKSEAERQLLDFLLHRVDHIHARVGSPESPQLPSSASGTAWGGECRAAHHAAWHRVLDIKSSAGVELVTATPEYGPPPSYTWTHPVSGEALYDVWEETERAAAELRRMGGEGQRG